MSTRAGSLAPTNEDEADIGRSLDFIQLCAVRVRYGEDQPVFTIGPWLHPSRPQSARALRRRHAHADVFNDVPDAVNAALFAHAAACTGGAAKWSFQRQFFTGVVCRN